LPSPFYRSPAFGLVGERFTHNERRRQVSRKIPTKFYTTPGEKAALKKLALKYGLSLSDFIRRAMIDLKIPDPSSHKMIEELYRINADIARLGNLLKLGIDEGILSEEKASDLLREIRATQGILKESALSIGDRRRRPQSKKRWIEHEPSSEQN
jgi:hypothetical protein